MVDTSTRLSSGIPGLDAILFGGFIPGGAYLIRGGPGSGKTTLGLQFLQAGLAAGEAVLFISLGEPVQQILKNAGELKIDVERAAFLDLSPTPEFFAEAGAYDVFSPAEVEREPTTARIVEKVDEVKPSRVFIDSVSQFRYLATDTFQYRKQVLSFLRYLTGQSITVLFTSESSTEAPDDDLQFLSDGIVHLTTDDRDRRVRVSKCRGSAFRPGLHAMRIGVTGIEVFPRLVVGRRSDHVTRSVLPSGIPGIDEMLHGGIEKGTITIFSGPSGVGKTTLGLQFLKESSGCGERSVVYTFEEEISMMTHRAESVSIPVRSMIEQGSLSIKKISPLQYSADEFEHVVWRDVQEHDTRLVMLDSISGYRLSLHGEDLVEHLHRLCKYLQSMEVTVLLVAETKAVPGDFRITDVDVSYFADNTLFLRYLEIDGELRKAIGVLKKRMSDFEKQLREYHITPFGIKVGDPLTGLRGILSGSPQWQDE